MKDLIAKLHLDANCALGAIWMHIDAQAKRIAELEAKIAASADTDKLREAIAGISNNAITDAWESCGGVGGFYKSFGYQQFAHAVLDLAADAVSSMALQAPVREVPEGMPVSQEPKYGIRDNRLFNRASGEFIPEDEPVFIFRARDWHATHVLAYYRQGGLQQSHSEAVSKRLKDFMAFRETYPWRMKEPDTVAALPAAPVQQEGE